MNQVILRFNLRVYFICFDDRGINVLLSDEIIRGRMYTKFPGGGLEFGEGTLECVQREALEELGQEVQVVRHFYTTDFFVQSAFYESDQVMSIYYVARLKKVQQFRTTTIRFDFEDEKEGAESFRWAEVASLNPDDFELPIDRRVAEMLLQGF